MITSSSGSPILIEVCVDSVQSALKLVFFDIIVLVLVVLTKLLFLVAVLFVRAQTESNSAETWALAVERPPAWDCLKQCRKQSTLCLLWLASLISMHLSILLLVIL
jgi:hypothetical protein